MITRILKKAKSLIRGSSPTPEPNKSRSVRATIISRKQHAISRKDISDNTLKVLYRLKKHGYQAYLVGGGVRDILLKKHPKDFDVVTNALPEEVRNIFSNCRLIGRRFRLAHVHFGRDIVEVATFRKQVQHQHDDVEHSQEGLIIRDNVYGTIEEDVWRRDFTINALYYNIADFSLVDFTGGLKDLEQKKLRMIGDTKTRYREDPVRILRAIRFASKLDFELSAELSKPIKHMKSLLSHVPPARLFEEVLKIFHSGAANRAYQLLIEHDLFDLLFKQTYQCLQENELPTQELLTLVFKSTDDRIKQQKGVTPVFIFATLLWHPIVKLSQVYVDEGMSLYPARLKAIEACLAEQTKSITIPKRIAYGAREIWLLQSRMQNRAGRRADRMMAEPRFKAAYDFLLIRAQANEKVDNLASWWQEYYEADHELRRKMIKAISGKPKRKRKKHVS